MEIKELLVKTPFFLGFSAKNLETLVGITQSRTVAKKEVLFFEGTEGNFFCLLLGGMVQLSKSTAEGKDVVIKLIQPGEIFGEVILFEQDEYPVTATALAESNIGIIPKDKFVKLLDDREFRDEFIRILIGKQRYLAEQIKYLTAHDVEDRLFNFFYHQYKGAHEFECELSKKDLAATIAATPETLSRLILRLTNEGKLKWEGKKISLS